MADRSDHFKGSKNSAIFLANSPDGDRRIDISSGFTLIVIDHFQVCWFSFNKGFTNFEKIIQWGFLTSFDAIIFSFGLINQVLVLYLFLFFFVLLHYKVHVQGIDIPYERGMMKVIVYICFLLDLLVSLSNSAHSSVKSVIVKRSSDY